MNVTYPPAAKGVHSPQPDYTGNKALEDSEVPLEAREWSGDDAIIMDAFIACSVLQQTMKQQGVSRAERRRMMRFVSQGYLHLPKEVK